MIFIVIPVFNRLHFTLACLESLEIQTCKDFQIVVVDHGSSDGTTEAINNRFPSVTVLQGNSEMWWTAATNLGIDFALSEGASHILTLNNDTIADSHLIESFLSVANENKRCLVGASAYDVNNKKLYFAGETFVWRSGKEVKFPLHACEFNNYCTHFPGRGLLIPREVFEKIGGFDDIAFPHYMADYDFSYRAFKNGYKIMCSSKVVLFIYPEASESNKLLLTKSFSGYRKHLFDIRGAGNLRNYFKFCWRNKPNILLFIMALTLGSARRILSYWK